MLQSLNSINNNSSSDATDFSSEPTSAAIAEQDTIILKDLSFLEEPQTSGMTIASASSENLSEEEEEPVSCCSLYFVFPSVLKCSQ